MFNHALSWDSSAFSESASQPDYRRRRAVIRSDIRRWNLADRYHCSSLHLFLSLFENKHSSTPKVGGCAFAGTSNKLDNRSAMLCIRVRRCASAAAAAALRVWSIAPSSPLSATPEIPRASVAPPRTVSLSFFFLRPSRFTRAVENYSIAGRASSLYLHVFTVVGYPFLPGAPSTSPVFSYGRDTRDVSPAHASSSSPGRDTP